MDSEMKLVTPTFLQAINKKYNIINLLAGTSFLIALVYIFDVGFNIFDWLYDVQNMSTIYLVGVVIASVLMGFLFAWLLIKSFSRKAGMSDGIIIMIILTIPLYYVIKEIQLKILHLDVPITRIGEYFTGLGVELAGSILLIVHSQIYRKSSNSYYDYKDKKANSTLRDYIKRFRDEFGWPFIIFIGLFCSVSVIFVLKFEGVQSMFLIRHKCFVLQLALGAFYLSSMLALPMRVKSKRVTMVDVCVYCMTLCNLTGLVLYIFTLAKGGFDISKTAFLVVGLAYSLIANIVIIKNTYIPTSKEKYMETTLINIQNDDFVAKNYYAYEKEDKDKNKQ